MNQLLDSRYVGYRCAVGQDGFTFLASIDKQELDLISHHSLHAESEFALVSLNQRHPRALDSVSRGIDLWDTLARSSYSTRDLSHLVRPARPSLSCSGRHSLKPFRPLVLPITRSNLCPHTPSRKGAGCPTDGLESQPTVVPGDQDGLAQT